jgi:hypothetical protein
MLKPSELHIYIDESGEMRACDEESHKRLKRIKKGVEYSFTYKVIRNYKFLKKFFSLLNLAYQNQDRYDNDVFFREDTLIGSGWCEMYYSSDGELRHKVKSISFEKCTEAEFEEVYNNTVTFLMSKYGFTDEFINQLLEYV